MSDNKLTAEQMERVHLMSEDDCGETLDLSANDCAALRALLDSHGRLMEALSRVLDTTDRYKYDLTGDAVRYECNRARTVFNDEKRHTDER